MLLQSSSQPQLTELKKVLPKGTCLVTDIKKHQYISRFICDPSSHTFIIPMPAEISSFVVVKTLPNKGHPIYHLYYRPNKTFLLSAQQQSMSIGCNYLISKDKVPSKNHNFIGKVRGNFQGDQFQLYDNGDNPDRIKNRPRKHLGYIRKEQHSQESGKSRIKMSMTVPKPQQSSLSTGGIHQYEPMDFISTEERHNPLCQQNLKKSQVSTEYLTLCEVGVSSNEERKFILESSIQSESLRLVKKTETFYELQIGCPLTYLQGFGCLLAMVEAFSL